MNRNVNLPTILVAVVVLAGLIYGIFRLNTRPQAAVDPGAGQIPPRVPGDDHPPPPPPGMHMPGTLKR